MSGNSNSKSSPERAIINTTSGKIIRNGSGCKDNSRLESLIKKTK